MSSAWRTTSYGTFRGRFSWISSYQRPDDPVLKELDQAMSHFYANLNDAAEYHRVASELNRDMLDGNHVLQEAAIAAARPGDIIIEFSCGGANFAPYFEAVGAKYFGFDLSCPTINPGDCGTRAVGSAYCAPFKTGCADLVLSFYSIEHMVWPAIYLDEMVRVAKKGANIILAFPDYLAGRGREIPSTRCGRSAGGVRDKLRRGAIWDAIQTYFERKLIYRALLLKLRKEIFKHRMRFMIQTAPSCLVAPWSIDTDAIYLASEEEVLLYLRSKGCTIERRSCNLVDRHGRTLDARFTGHAFLTARPG